MCLSLIINIGTFMSIHVEMFVHLYIHVPVVCMFLFPLNLLKVSLEKRR